MIRALARRAMSLVVDHQRKRRSKALGKCQSPGLLNRSKRGRDSDRSDREQGNDESQTAHVSLLCELDYHN